MFVTNAQTHVFDASKQIQPIEKAFVVDTINLFAPEQCGDGDGRASQTTTSLIKNLVRPCSKVSNEINESKLEFVTLRSNRAGGSYTRRRVGSG